MKRKRGIRVFIVKNPQEGIILANKILNKDFNKKTVLFLSGGSTPKPLYELFAKEKKLAVGAVGMIDERYGEIQHANSNEKVFMDTGLLNYFKNKNIPFYSILKKNQDLKNTATLYDKKVRNLFDKFKKKIAIMGIGEDGHTASLAAGTPSFAKASAGKQNYVESISDFPGKFKERITLTFKALSQMDLLIILVFGSAKKKALSIMFKNGYPEEIPARFYTKPAIADKTILITDQKV